jgi:hypothetical protein
VSRVYSTQLLAINGLAAEVTYTVPAGLTAVVREIDVASAVGGGWSCSFKAAGVGHWLYMASSDVGARNTESGQWHGRLILAAGQVLQVEPGTGTPTVIVSGYLLST